MSKQITTLAGFVMLLIALLITGCKDNGSSPVEIEMKKTGGVQFSLNKASGAENVSKVSAILTRKGYSAIKKDLAISGQSAAVNINNVAIGTWQLLVEAKNTSEEVLFQGTATIKIEGEKTTYVNINLSAPAAQGNLAINVTWNIGDGLVWTKHTGNPILAKGAAGSWDSHYAQLPSVLHDGTEYKMWYSGYDGSKTRIGLATSSDGVNWTKHSGNPVLDVGAQGEWDNLIVFCSDVIFDGTEYKMWYCGASELDRYQIGYATSPDGINWTKYPDNPVMRTGDAGSWDNKFLLSPTVLYDGQKYKMWFTGWEGTTRQIGYATSADGIHWSKHSGNPILSKTAGAWDSFTIGGATVLHDGNKFRMWYNGSDGFNHRIGYATSPDGVSWTKHTGGAVMNIGADGTWDDVHIFFPCVIYDQNTFKMWYSGFDSQNNSIGYATSP